MFQNQQGFEFKALSNPAVLDPRPQCRMRLIQPSTDLLTSPEAKDGTGNILT